MKKARISAPFQWGQNPRLLHTRQSRNPFRHRGEKEQKFVPFSFIHIPHLKYVGNMKEYPSLGLGKISSLPQDLGIFRAFPLYRFWCAIQSLGLGKIEPTEALKPRRANASRRIQLYLYIKALGLGKIPNFLPLHRLLDS